MKELKKLDSYFNPRPPWGGRRIWRVGRNFCVKISIHALRGEGDVSDTQRYRAIGNISIHALRGEGDEAKRKKIYCDSEFQSTPSVGRATKPWHLLCDARGISIHALRGEGDSP